MTLEAIRYKDGALTILNQLLLPLETVYEEIHGVGDGWRAVREMKVRGAPAIAIVSGLSLAVQLNKSSFNSPSEAVDFITEKLTYLKTARPTAVNMKNMADDITTLATKLKESGLTVAEVVKGIVDELESMLSSDIAANKKIGFRGANHILQLTGGVKQRVLTHCNTGSLATAGYGTALGVIRALAEKNMLEETFCTETRPYNQGARLTAYELVHDNIPATLIMDSMVSHCMKEKKITAVVVGADRIVANGDTANKIGTYQLAIAAKHHGIPFYIAAPVSTVDLHKRSGVEIPIEERPHKEMTHIQGQQISASGIGCWNPAFDVTPAELITGGIITEYGVYKPSELEKNVLKNLSSQPQKRRKVD